MSAASERFALLGVSQKKYFTHTPDSRCRFKCDPCENAFPHIIQRKFFLPPHSYLAWDDECHVMSCHSRVINCNYDKMHDACQLCQSIKRWMNVEGEKKKKKERDKKRITRISTVLIESQSELQFGYATIMKREKCLSGS